MNKCEQCGIDLYSPVYIDVTFREIDSRSNNVGLLESYEKYFCDARCLKKYINDMDICESAHEFYEKWVCEQCGQVEEL